MGIFTPKEPEPKPQPTMHTGVVERIATTMWSGSISSTLMCHVLLRTDTGRDVVSFSFDEQPAIALTEKGDTVLIGILDEDLASFENDTLNLKAVIE